MIKYIKENLITISENIILWLTGGLFYFYMEIAYRDYSHYSMIICGGCCFLIVGNIGKYILNKKFNIFKSIVLIMFFGSLTITSLEFITGIIVNLILKKRVWNYSVMKYNVFGQICLVYSALWALMSLLCVYVLNIIRIMIFEKNEPDLK